MGEYEGMSGDEGISGNMEEYREFDLGMNQLHKIQYNTGTYGAPLRTKTRTIIF